MTIKQKFLGLVLTVILVAAFAVGVAGVFAQDSGNPTPTPYPSGTAGYGWNMHGMMWDGSQSDSIWTSVAGALGIDVNSLFTELQSGKTLAQIAEAHGVDIQAVYDAALTTMTDHMRSMVGTGHMTQAQVDSYLTWMRDNIGQMPMFNGLGFNHYPTGGMMGGNGQGMMGGMMGYGMHDGQGWHDDNGWTGMMHGGCP